MGGTNNDFREKPHGIHVKKILRCHQIKQIKEMKQQYQQHHQQKQIC